ncbi:MAG: choice-of-anchor J domain-containing protein [Thermoplasmatota archaeon]
MEDWGEGNNFITAFIRSPSNWHQYEINATVNGVPSGACWFEDPMNYYSPHSSAYHHNLTSSEPDLPYFDDWLVTPQISLPPKSHMRGDLWLDFWENNANMSKYYGENAHSVWISLAGPNPDPDGDGHIDDGNYTLLAEFDDAVNDWTLRHINLSKYAGHNIYIAFRYMGNNSSKWWIDDVEIRSEVENPGFIRACQPIYLNATDYPEEKAVDQEQLDWSDWAKISGMSVPPRYAQTFTAGVSQLDAVKLPLWAENESNVGVIILQGAPSDWWHNLDSSLLAADMNVNGPGGPTGAIGMAQKYIPPCGNESSPAWWQFHFVPSINLVPGETYTIMPVVFSTGTGNVSWAYETCPDDAYPGGALWWHNGEYFQQNDTMDFAFQTEYWTGQESVCESGIQHKFYKYVRWNGTDWVEYPQPAEEGNANVINISQFYTREEIKSGFMRQWIGGGGYHDPYLWYVYDEEEGIHFMENCTHHLYYWAKDNVCHHTDVYHQKYYVDDRDPVVEKTHPDHGWYPVIEVYGNTDYDTTDDPDPGDMQGEFHVAAEWSTDYYDDGWEPNTASSDPDVYKKKDIHFVVENNDPNNALTNLRIWVQQKPEREGWNDEGISLNYSETPGGEGWNVTYQVYEVPPIPAGETDTFTITVYDNLERLRGGEWEWGIMEDVNITQYLKAGAKITLTAHDHDEPEDKVVDQEQDNWDPVTPALDMVSQPPWWDAQEFYPTANRLDAVELNLGATPGSTGGANVTVTIVTPWGVPLGSATKHIPYLYGDSSWYQFHFDPPISLIQGGMMPYYIAVSLADNSGEAYWRYDDGDSYPDGNAWVDGITASVDWTFRTEYYEDCPSGVENIFWRYEWNRSEYPYEGTGGHGARWMYGWELPGITNATHPEIGPYAWYIYDNETDIHFTEECRHDLYYFAKDKTCHVSDVHHQIYLVDASPPHINETLPPHGSIGKTTQTLFEDFEMPFGNGWAVVDGVASSWTIKTDETEFWNYDQDVAYSGRYAAFAYRWDAPFCSWLITPKVTIPEDGNVTFYYRTYGDSTQAELEVGVSTAESQTDIAGFSDIVWSTNFSDNSAYRRAEVDLSAYKDQEVYIGFHCSYLDRTYTSGGGLLLDDVWIGGIHRIDTVLDDDVENGEDGWQIDDLTAQDSFWRTVRRIPETAPTNPDYGFVPPAPSIWCGSLVDIPSDTCYNNNVNEGYSCNWNDTLTMKTPVDLSAVDPSDPVIFEFEAWYDIGTGDALYVEVSNDSVNWTGNMVGPIDGTDDWATDTVDLSNYIGNGTVWVRFRFQTDDILDTAADGVFIDNVSIYNSTNTFFSDTFGTLSDPDMSHWDAAMLETSKWHIVEEEDYHSENHSWWCGVDATDQYLNCMNDALMSPAIDLTDASYDGKQAMLMFWHTYSMKQDYDYGYVEINDGTGWNTLASYTGSRSWVKEFINITDYIGDTVHIRFRFASDDSDKMSGWYLDDFELEIREYTETTYDDTFDVYKETEDVADEDALPRFPPTGRDKDHPGLSDEETGVFYGNWTESSNVGASDPFSSWTQYGGPWYSTAVCHGAYYPYQSENLITPVIEDLPKFSNLTFRHWFTDSSGGATGYVIIKNASGEQPYEIRFQSSSSGFVDIPLWKYHGQDIQIIFRFYTGSESGSTNDYWAIEWVNVTSYGFLRQGAEITLDVDDDPLNQSECDAGIEAIFYRYTENGNKHPDTCGEGVICGSELACLYGEDYDIPEITKHEWYVVYDDYLTISFDEECIHDLYYFAKDNVCHRTDIVHERYYVDGTPPETWLNVSWGSLGDHPWIPKNDGDSSGQQEDYWYKPGDNFPSVICIKDDFHFHAEHTNDSGSTEGTCIYPYYKQDRTYYRWEIYNYTTGKYEVAWPTQNDTEIEGVISGYEINVSNHEADIQPYWWMNGQGPDYFPEGCKHKLVYFSKDDLCNTEQPTYWVVGVDDEKPETDLKFYGDEDHYFNVSENLRYMQNDTQICLEAHDMPNHTECQTGVWYINYAVWRWQTSEYTIRVPTNVIAGGNIMYDHFGHVYDTVTVEDLGYYYDAIDSNGDGLWTTSDYIYLDWTAGSRSDGIYHIEDVKDKGSCYHLTVRDCSADASGKWVSMIPWTRTDDGVSQVCFGEELFDECGKYEIHYYAVDYNNMTEEVHVPDIMVDCTPPVSTKTFGEPVNETQIEGGETVHYVNATTPICFSAVDPRIWDSGVKQIQYRFETTGMGDPSYYEWKNITDYFDVDFVSEGKKYCFNLRKHFGQDFLDDWYEAYNTSKPFILYHRAIDNVSHMELEEDTGWYKQKIYYDPLLTETSPNISKGYDDPNILGPPVGELQSDLHFIRSDTPIWLNGTDKEGGLVMMQISIFSTEDPEPFPEGEEDWMTVWTGGPTDMMNYTFTIGSLSLDLEQMDSYWLFYRAIDEYGLVSDVGKQRFRLDDTPPTTDIEALAEEYTYGDDIVINATAQDNSDWVNVSSVTLMYRYYNETSETWGSWMKYDGVMTEAPYIWHFDAPMGPGDYEFRVDATDRLNNTETSTTAEASTSVIPVAGDFDGNGEVDLDDLMEILDYYGVKKTDDPDYWNDNNLDMYDLYDDDEINILDLTILADNWG